MTLGNAKAIDMFAERDARTVNVQVKAIRPERDALEIRFPRVEGYRVELPEERLTYHVLESNKPAAALIDYARMNEVQQVLLGAPRTGGPMRLFTSVATQVVLEAPCTVSIVRPRPES